MGILFARVPAPGLVLVGILSVQVGAGLAKQLFTELPPLAVVTMRLLVAAAIMVLIARSSFVRSMRRAGRRAVWPVLGLGLALAVMNASIYQAFARIPLGIAVAIEFLGPLGLALVLSRRRLDLLWVLLAGTGVVLFATGETGSVTLSGVLFALLAGVGWASYILCSARVGREIPGTGGLAVASVVAALLVAPVGIPVGGTDLLDPHALLIGLSVGLLSSVVPYTLEMEALRRIPERVFGIYMSIEPAMAALVGVVLLQELLSLPEWFALGCIVLASIGSNRTSRGTQVVTDP